MYYRALSLCLASTIALCASAQSFNIPENVTDYADFELNVANNHLWRGIEVTDGFVFTTSLAVHDKGNHVRAGIWGGTNTSGSYKEFNYFAEFAYAGFKLAFWDTMNFSPANAADYNVNEFFNYSAHSTGRFLDCILSYDFNKRIPLTLAWSTIIFGRDRYATDPANRYSTFVYGEYTVAKNDKWSVDLGVGGTFVLNHRDGDSSTFYSDRPGIIHAQLKVTHNLHITQAYTLPVHLTAVWNPRMDCAYLQVGATLFSF